MQLDRKQDLNVPLSSLCFGADQKTRHFRLLLWNHCTEFNETWLETRSQRPLPSLCIWCRSAKKMAALASDWVRYFRLSDTAEWKTFSTSLKPLNGIQWNLTRSKIQRPLPRLCFWGRSEKQDGRSDLWLDESFSTSPRKQLYGIQRNLTGSKILTSSTMFVFLGPIWKTRSPTWPLIGWDIFDFSPEIAEWNSKKLDRSKISKSLGACYMALWASCFFFSVGLDY